MYKSISLLLTIFIFTFAFFTGYASNPNVWFAEPLTYPYDASDRPEWFDRLDGNTLTITNLKEIERRVTEAEYGGAIEYGGTTSARVSEIHYIYNLAFNDAPAMEISLDTLRIEREKESANATLEKPYLELGDKVRFGIHHSLVDNGVRGGLYVNEQEGSPKEFSWITVSDPMSQ